MEWGGKQKILRLSLNFRIQFVIKLKPWKINYTGGKVVRYRHVCLGLPSGWVPYFAQLPQGSFPPYLPYLCQFEKKIKLPHHFSQKRLNFFRKNSDRCQRRKIHGGTSFFGQNKYRLTPFCRKMPHYPRVVPYTFLATLGGGCPHALKCRTLAIKAYVLVSYYPPAPLNYNIMHTQHPTTPKIIYMLDILQNIFFRQQVKVKFIEKIKHIKWNNSKYSNIVS